MHAQMSVCSKDAQTVYEHTIAALAQLPAPADGRPRCTLDGDKGGLGHRGDCSGGWGNEVEELRGGTYVKNGRLERAAFNGLAGRAKGFFRPHLHGVVLPLAQGAWLGKLARLHVCRAPAVERVVCPGPACPAGPFSTGREAPGKRVHALKPGEVLLSVYVCGPAGDWDGHPLMDMETTLEHKPSGGHAVLRPWDLTPKVRGHWALGTGHWALGTGHWALAQ